MIDCYNLYTVSTPIGRKPLILLGFLHFQRVWRWMDERNENIHVHKSKTMMLIQEKSEFDISGRTGVSGEERHFFCSVCQLPGIIFY